MARKETVIHLVRHGEVENPQHVRYGRLPGFHLSTEGRRQAEHAGTFFLNRPITHIYSSPLERTQQTATLVGLTLPHAPIRLDSRILEVKTATRFEGKPRDIDFYYTSKATTDAETPAQIYNRMYHFLEEKVIEHNGQEIVAVTHGDPLAILFHTLVYNESTTNWRLYPSYAAIFSYVFDGLTLRAAWYTSLIEEAAL